MNDETSTTITTEPRRRRRRSLMVTGGVALTGLAASFALYGVTASASGSSADPSRPIRADQTDGYADGKVVVFTYGQNYQCVHQPFDDRDGDGIPAAQDPDEFQKPICEVGFGTKVGIDPAGRPAGETEDLFVIVPFFDADHDGEAAGGLAPTLSNIFGGLVPDAFDPTPGVPVQCPEPGGPLSQQKGAFGTCTMHPTQIDYAQLLSEVRPDLFAGLKNLNLPLVNHSHIIRGANFGSVWWHLKVVLVTDQSAWPDVNGMKGIRSVEDIAAAQASGKALATINSNFFLFFNSRELHQH